MKVNQLLKFFSIMIMAAVLIIPNSVYSAEANSTKYYNLLVKSNDKNSDYLETITTETTTNGKTNTSKSKYQYSKNSDTALVQQPMFNQKVNMAITNAKNASKKAIYIYNSKTKKYEKSPEMFMMGNINLTKFIDISNNGLNIIAKNSKITTGKNTVIIKTNLSKEQITKLQSEEQNTQVMLRNNGNNQGKAPTSIQGKGQMPRGQFRGPSGQNGSGGQDGQRDSGNQGGPGGQMGSRNQRKWNPQNGNSPSNNEAKPQGNMYGFRSGMINYDSLQYTIVLTNNKITSVIVEETQKADASKKTSAVKKKTTYTITYASQSSIQKTIKGKLTAGTSQNNNFTGFNNSNRNFSNNGKWQKGFMGGQRSRWSSQTNINIASVNINIITTLAAFLFAFIIMYIFMIKKTEHKLVPKLENKWIYISAMFVIFLVKLLMAYNTPGLSGDMGLFKQWSINSSSNGLSNFYITGSADYPPGYIYILYLLGRIQNVFGLGDALFSLLIKTPAIIADTVIAYVIFIAAKSRFKKVTAVALSLLYVFNPAVVLDSALWGQVDSVYALFIVLSIYFLTKKNIRIASIIFVIGILVKPQSLIFSPLFIYAFIKRKSIKELLISAGLSVITFAILIIPFSINQSSPFWIINLYKNTLSSYPYASVNAFNLFALFGGNYAQDTSTFFLLSYKIISLIFIIGIVIFSAWLYFNKTNAATGAENQNDNYSEGSKYYLIATFIITSVFTITSKMHERYLYPALALAIMSYIYMNNKKVLVIFFGVSCTFFMNVYYVFANNAMSAVGSLNAWIIVTAICNLILLGYIINIAVHACLIPNTDRINNQ